MKKSKSGEPVTDKYKGVKIANEQLLFVPFIIAGRLKKAGYDIPCEYFYGVDGNISCKSDNINWNASEDAFSAPRLEEVKKWLKSRGITINVYCRTERVKKDDGEHYDYVATSDWMRSIYANVDGKCIQIKRPVSSFVSEEDALAIAIREGVKYLLNKEK